jgi:hypothetical protein
MTSGPIPSPPITAILFLPGDCAKSSKLLLLDPVFLDSC